MYVGSERTLVSSVESFEITFAENQPAEIVIVGDDEDHRKIVSLLDILEE